MSDSAAFSPDMNGTGFVGAPLDPLRYDGHTDHPYQVAGKLRSMMPTNVRVLDVGCGTGSVAMIANKNKGNVIFGIEPDAARAKVAASRGIHATCGYLDEKFIAEKGPFDVVVFSDVLEHLASPEQMLKLAATGLKSDGVMLVSVPNVAHWSVRLNLLFGRFNYTETGLCDSTHLRWFTRDSIQALFKHEGFDILELQYTERAVFPVRRSVARCVRVLLKIFPALFAWQFVLKVSRSA